MSMIEMKPIEVSDENIERQNMEEVKQLSKDTQDIKECMETINLYLEDQYVYVESVEQSTEDTDNMLVNVDETLDECSSGSRIILFIQSTMIIVGTSLVGIFLLSCTR